MDLFIIFGSILLPISIVVAIVEIVKYRREEAEMCRTNDMYVFHMRCLSYTGCIAIATIVISIFLLLMGFLIDAKFCFQ